MAIDAEELFVFAGAGTSMSMPAGLPAFNAVRDEILCQLGLAEYVPGAMSRRGGAKPEVAAGLVPEPFLLELSEAGVSVPDWLRLILSAGQPNAVHHALAGLAAAGARVWTVNFDTNIEQAAGARLGCIAWPQDPAEGAPLMKPHGSIGGELIVTSQQVLAGLDQAWLERLSADIDGRLVVFLGYSGRDLDFQPVWGTVLATAAKVLWFDVWDDGQPADHTRKKALLWRVDARGDLIFPRPAPLPPGVLADAAPNPSWDFIAWCDDQQLAEPDPVRARQLFDRPPGISYPPLPGDIGWARPAVQGLLGDYRAARRSYLSLTLQPGGRGKAAAAVGMSIINHGGDGVAVLLAPTVLMPLFGRVGRLRETAHRKRVTIWSRTGRHSAVLRATRRLPPTAVSTYLILRSESLRITGSLDEAAATAEAARVLALQERHPVRVAHAAFQRCLAQLWAERLDEARRSLADDFTPYAALAASRWVAWADFVAAGLAVRDHDHGEAIARLALSEQRFRAETLLDGVVSVMVARLAAHRLGGDTGSYLREVDEVTRLSRQGGHRQRYYTRRNTFTAESIDIDRAEFARVHQHDLHTAEYLYGRAAASRYPLHAALGHLGLALVETQKGLPPRHADAATQLAEHTGCRLARRRARELRTHPAEEDVLREVFFC